MQLLVRNLEGRTITVSAAGSDTVADLKHALEAKDGLPVRYQSLVHAGRLLQDDAALADCGLAAGATVQQCSRLLGGKPVKVKILTNHLPCGQEVIVDLEPAATKAEIKRKLEPITGVPVEHQKVMLSGINQIVMGDKRTNIAYTACGSTNGVQMAVTKEK